MAEGFGEHVNDSFPGSLGGHTIYCFITDNHFDDSYKIDANFN